MKVGALCIKKEGVHFDTPSFSCLPTSHTTVRAVRHTAVSCFYTSRRVTSCFQPSLRDTSLLFYCRIPSYRVNREFLFGHLTTKDSQCSSHLLLYCTIQSFPLGNPCLGYYDLCWLLTTSFTPSWYINTSSSPCVRETSSDKGIVFPSYTYFIYTDRSE